MSTPVQITDKPRSKGRIALLVFLIVLLGLGGFGVSWYIEQHNYVSTDNAKISGDILNVSSKIPGKVAVIKVQNGDKVKKGDVLFTLGTGQLQAQVNQAQAALNVAKASLAKAEGGARSEEVAGAQALVDQAQAVYSGATTGRDNLQSTLNDLQSRYNDLLQQMSPFKNPATGEYDAAYATKMLDQALAAKQLDDAQYTVKTQAVEQLFSAKSQLESQIEQAKGQLGAVDSQVQAAKAGWQGAQSKLALVNAGASSKDIAIVEAQVQGAQATYDLAKLSLGYAQVTAPADGTVVQVNIHVGDVIAPGQAAVSLVNMNKLQVTANILETDIERIKPNQPVTLTIDAFPGQTFSGTVNQVGLATSSTFNLFNTDNASGNFTKVNQTIPVKIDLNPKGQPIIPGLSVSVKIKVTH